MATKKKAAKPKKAKGPGHKFERVPAADIERVLDERKKEGWKVQYSRFNSGENDLAVLYTK